MDYEPQTTLVSAGLGTRVSKPSSAGISSSASFTLPPLHLHPSSGTDKVTLSGAIMQQNSLVSVGEEKVREAQNPVSFSSSVPAPPQSSLLHRFQGRAGYKMTSHKIWKAEMQWQPLRSAG